MGVQINGDTGNISATKADYSGNVTIGGTLTYEDVTNIDSVGLITARNGIEVGARPGVGASISVDGNAEFAGIVTATQFKGDGSQLSNITSTTINANADNRVITGSDTANTLNGESSLTYDGSTLKIDGGLIEIAHTSCHLDFMETSTTNHRLRNGSGNFQIQKISDDKNTTTTQFLVDGGTGQVELYHNGTKQCETSTNGLAFPSGKGIDFSAASGSASGSTSAVLDDYEEGTYTPFVLNGFDPSIATNTGAYDTQSGYYRKVGTLVEFNFYIRIHNSQRETDGGHLKVSLPFTQDSSNQKRGHGFLTYNTFTAMNVGSNGIGIYIYDSKAELYSGSTAVSGGNGDSQANRYLIGGGLFHAA